MILRRLPSPRLLLEKISAQKATFIPLHPGHALQGKDLVHRNNVLLDIVNAAVDGDPPEGLTHCSHRRSDRVITVDIHGDLAG
jgi:hypothetical protein